MKKRSAVALSSGIFLFFMAGITNAAGIIFYTDTISFGAVVSTTLVEDFESFTPKDTKLTAFTSNGITYTGLAGSPYDNVMVASPGYTNFGAGLGGATDTSILIANGAEDFLITFPTPVRAVGFDAYYNGMGPVSIRVYGAGGLLLDALTISSTEPFLDGKGYMGIVSDKAAITSIRWASTGGEVLNTGIDNLSVNAVPIPSAFCLLCFGIAGIIGINRKKPITRTV